jgi:putative restriction endonuclease
MRAYVAITDSSWYELLAARMPLQEVNFWQPGGRRRFTYIGEGELFLFKLHSPDNFVVGGGVLAHSSLQPLSVAWEAFGLANGVTSLAEMRSRIEYYRRTSPDPLEDYTIGCTVLTQPFFLPRDLWVPVPPDWPRSTMQGLTYDLTRGTGLALYDAVTNAMRYSLPFSPIDESQARYGAPTVITPRLGQGAFRLVVTEAYEKRCSITGERVLPVLEAAHIRPFALGGEHQVQKGVLLRSDLHVLFDRGYITITPSHEVEISRRIKEEFENGNDYYALHGRSLRDPTAPSYRPSAQHLIWHNENVFRA